MIVAPKTQKKIKKIWLKALLDLGLQRSRSILHGRGSPAKNDSFIENSSHLVGKK